MMSSKTRLLYWYLSAGIGKQPATGPDQLKRMIISHLIKLQKLPGLVRSFFGALETIYAAI